MKKSRIFKTLAIFGACLSAPLLLTGCQAGDNGLLEFRVQDGYVQYTKDGRVWEDIFSIDEINSGKDGNGIKSITIDQANSDSTKTTYIITFDDNTTYSYEVKNGTNGSNGEDGQDGSVVTIGPDGYWYIDGVKTDVKAKGTDGTNGKDGVNGVDGEEGNGIKSITNDPLNSDTTKTTYIITFDDNTTYSYIVKNGVNGENGEDGENGKDGSVVTIGSDGYWYIDGVKTDVKAKGQDGTNGTDGKDAEIDTYIITYDYGVADTFFADVKETETIKATQWLTTLPEINSDYEESFLGWFISGTEKQIKNYDFIGGNVTLEARFDVKIAPAGLYQNGKYVTTWENLIKSSSGYTVSPVLKRYDGHIVFDKSVTEISMGAFEQQNELTGITINSNISIGACAFAYCSNLKDIFFNSSNITLGGQIFADCTALEEITIPGSIKSIPDYIFSGCTNLSKLTIEEGVDTIGSQIVANTKLKKIYIPQSITNVDTTAFMYSHIEEYVVDEKNATYSTIDGLLYNKDKTELISCPYAFNGIDGKYTIPSGVTKIGNQAFYFSNLTSITLADTIQTIGNKAFYGCDGLDGMFIPASVIEIGKNAFESCKESFVLDMLDDTSTWNVNNNTVTIVSGGREAKVNDGEEVSLGTLITSTYKSYIWTKQTSE